jgi:hypothetical protein
VTRPGLGNKTLTIQSGIEFKGADAIEVITTPISVPTNSYSHKILIPMPIDSSFDEDVFVHIGNNEPVKDFYYLYVKK